MGDVLLQKDGQTKPFPEELVPDAQRVGWQLAGPVRAVTDEGQTVLPTSSKELGGLIEQGSSLESPGEQRAAGQRARLESEYGDRPVSAGALGLLSGLTLGGSDVAVEALGSEDTRRFLREVAGRNRKAYIAGQVGSALIPGFAMSKGGLLGRAIRFTPAGAASMLAQGAGVATAGALGAEAAATVGGRALQLGVEGLVEGAPYAAGQAISDAVIDNKDLSAESLLSQATTGALIGGGLGAGIGAIGGVLERAAGRRLAAAEDGLIPRVSDLASPEAKGFRDQVRHVGETLDGAHDEVVRGLDDEIGRLDEGVGRRFSVEVPGKMPAKNAAAVDKLSAELEAVHGQLEDLDAGRELTGQGVTVSRGRRVRKMEADLAKVRLDLDEARSTIAGNVDEGVEGITRKDLERTMVREKQLAAREAELADKIKQTRRGAGRDAPVAAGPEERAALERKKATLQVRIDEALKGTPAQTLRDGLTRQEARAAIADLRSQGTRALVREGAADAEGVRALGDAQGLKAELADARAGVDDLIHQDPTQRRWSDEGINEGILGKAENFRRFRSSANKYHEVIRKAAEGRAPAVARRLDDFAAEIGRVPEAGERFAGMSAVDLLAAANQAGVVDVNDIPVVGPVADLMLKGRLLFHTAPGLLGAGAGRLAARLPKAKIGRFAGFTRNALQRSVGINVARNSGFKHAISALLPGVGGRMAADAAAGLHGAVAGAGVKGIFDDIAGIGVAAEKQARAVEHKIGAAVTSFIKAKRAARTFVPASVTILSKVHFGGASPKQAARGQTPYQKRAAELREAMANMPATEKHLATALEPVRLASPQLFDLMYRTAMRRLKFLALKLPKNPGIGSALVGYRDYDPPRHEQMRFARYVAATENPLSVLDSLAAGAVSPEEVETLRAVYPEMYRTTQSFLLQYIPKHADEIPYDRRVQIGILFGVPADSSMRPDFVQGVQAMYAAEAAKEPEPSAGARSQASAKLGGKTEMTSSQRLSVGSV